MAERQAFQRKWTTMRMSRTGSREGRKERQGGWKGSYGECKPGKKMGRRLWFGQLAGEGHPWPGSVDWAGSGSREGVGHHALDMSRPCLTAGVGGTRTECGGGAPPEAREAASELPRERKLWPKSGGEQEAVERAHPGRPAWPRPVRHTGDGLEEESVSPRGRDGQRSSRGPARGAAWVSNLPRRQSDRTVKLSTFQPLPNKHPVPCQCHSQLSLSSVLIQDRHIQQTTWQSNVLLAPWFRLSSSCQTIFAATIIRSKSSSPTDLSGELENASSISTICVQVPSSQRP